MGIKWGYSASTQYGDVMRICGDQYIGKSELCGEYPPTPADSRGSASEKRGQDGQEANKNVKVNGLQRLALWAAGCRPDPSFGVWALREGPLTGAVQDESQLQEDTSKLAVGGAEEQAKSRFGASF